MSLTGAIWEIKGKFICSNSEPLFINTFELKSLTDKILLSDNNLSENISFISKPAKSS